MKYLFLLLLTALIGCQSSSDREVAQEVTIQAPAPAPRPPRVDETFMNERHVSAWRDQIAIAIQEDASTVHPRDMWRYTSEFRIGGNGPDPYIGDPDVWSSTWTPFEQVLAPDATQTIEEAKRLEMIDQKWPAGQMFAQLGDIASANRCAKKLFDEGSYKASAMVAVLTGDEAMMTASTTRMLELDWTTKTVEVIQYAVQMDKPSAGRFIAQAHGWELSNVLRESELRRMALAGDDEMLMFLIENGIKVWESGDTWEIGGQDDPTGVVADIAILGKTNPVKAREYAGRYLRLPHANVFIWDHCGEGCYLQPVRGSLELYQLVKGDAVLRELYFSHIRQWFVDTFPAEGEVAGDPVTLGAPEFLRGFGLDMWGSDGGYRPSNLLFTHLWQVRQSGDADLKAFWAKMIDALPTAVSDDGSFAFEREFGRYVLGLSFDASNSNLNGGEQIALATMQGRPAPDMSGVWTTWGINPPVEYEIEQMNWLFQFLVRGSITSAREKEIMTELEIEPVEGFSFQSQLTNRFGSALNAHYGTNYRVEDRMKSAGDVMRLNRRAQAERIDLGLPPVDLYPDTDSELTELLAPSLALMEQKLPARHARFKGKTTP